MNRIFTLEAFINVVDSGSFSGAAKLLRVGQPAVSKAISKLEEHIGVTLLRRSTRGVSPTEAGLKFYAHAKRALEESEMADIAARDAGAAFSGQLRVCAAVSFVRLHLIRCLPDFMAANPGLNIDLILDDRNVDLIEAAVDVALRMGTMRDSNLTARKIADAPRLLVASPAYLERMGTPQKPDELTGHQTIVYDVLGGGSLWTFTRDAIDTTVALGGRLRITAAEGVREAVLRGLGMAVVSQWMFAPELAEGRVKVVLPEWSLPRIDLWAVFPTGRQTAAKAKGFVDFVEACLAKSW